MSNPLFQQIGGQQATPMNPAQLVQQIKSDPAGMLRQKGLTIPAGMNNPQQIVQYLLNSGQVPQARYQQAMQMAAQFRR